MNIFMHTVFAQSAVSLNVLPAVIEDLFSRVWPFIGLAVFGMFIYGGILWLTSRGDPQMLAKAQSTLVWTAIGAGVLALVIVIIDLLAGFVGVQPDLFKHIPFI